jgi:undecaprenyl diphosphate synthase
MTDNSKITPTQESSGSLQFPRAIGMIMDGNRRWAKERNIPSLEGHKAGYEKIKDVLNWCRDSGLKELTIYAFSTENCSRDEKEVSYLLELFRLAFSTWLKDIEKEEVNIRFIGERSILPDDIQKSMQMVEERTKDFAKGTLIIALSYGGRAEILDAVNRLLEKQQRKNAQGSSNEKSSSKVTEEELRNEMWSAGLQDPDVIIRTGGDHRLSNFLTWQSAYSEIYFTDTKWPDFSKEEFETILSEFSSRERRFGK